MSKYAGQKIRVVSAEIRRDGRYLIVQRLATSSLPHLWEFPGGRVPDHESPERCLRRLLMERLGVDVDVGELVMQVVHEYEQYTVDMQVYRCEVHADEEPRPVRVQDARWVEPSDFHRYEFPAADEQTISSLLGLTDDPPRDIAEA